MYCIPCWNSYAENEEKEEEEEEEEEDGGGGEALQAAAFDGTRYQISELLALRPSEAAAAPSDMLAAVAASVPRDVAECTGQQGGKGKGQGKRAKAKAKQAAAAASGSGSQAPPPPLPKPALPSQQALEPCLPTFDVAQLMQQEEALRWLINPMAAAAEEHMAREQVRGELERDRMRRELYPDTETSNAATRPLVADAAPIIAVGDSEDRVVEVVESQDPVVEVVESQDGIVTVEESQ